MTTFRNEIVSAAARICDFNRKLTVGRSGFHSLNKHTTNKEIGYQDLLVREETNEFDRAYDVPNMLKEAIDMLVVEVWLDVLSRAHMQYEPALTIGEAIDFVLKKYKYEPLSLRCIPHLVFLSKMGVDVPKAINAVLNDNESKFVTNYKESADTVKYYRDVLGLEVEARPVDLFQRDWGIFRIPDLKLMKPKSYEYKVKINRGLDLYPYVPSCLRSMRLITLDGVAGDSTIFTIANRSIV